MEQLSQEVDNSSINRVEGSFIAIGLGGLALGVGNELADTLLNQSDEVYRGVALVGAVSGLIGYFGFGLAHYIRSMRG